MKMAETKFTTDREAIKRWAEERNATPATVKGTGDGGPGVLRFDFDEKEESLEEISWDDFFSKFDESELGMIYQEKTDSGETSRFFKFVDREDHLEGS